jgi:ABC-type uncharacterized transport system permease subunit
MQNKLTVVIGFISGTTFISALVSFLFVLLGDKSFTYEQVIATVLISIAATGILSLLIEYERRIEKKNRK